MFRFGSIILAGGLLAAPAQAAVMQAVFTGVETYRGHEYTGVSYQGAPVINESEWSYDYVGTPVTWVITYDTDVGLYETIETTETFTEHDNAVGVSYEQSLKWETFARFSELTWGDMTFSHNISPDYLSVANLTSFRYMYPDGVPLGHNEVESYAMDIGSYLQLENEDWSSNNAWLRALIHDSQLFSSSDPTFDLTQEFSVIFGATAWSQGYFYTDKSRALYDEEGNYDGYQRFIEGLNWSITSLTVTRLDTEPSIPAVPLPASAPLLLAALGGLAALRRRKRV
ncbi:VPLPA-CTERM sorting domain-containing protein [Paenirhodobacter populi]|uniref:VPLPA-CTERM sorting domain-containing protein n=1 Tax=Paenirhodobacter populi TaxID=2306993 RepID=UPI000FE33AB1|nr:VPLPA-CTERM sorting domain-containing protein [Sinirhodobacter populi]RWR08708.1 VPLPA-CTERM sorting domain-containing protein [Sinirhodobacter populi]